MPFGNVIWTLPPNEFIGFAAPPWHTVQDLPPMKARCRAQEGNAYLIPLNTTVGFYAAPGPATDPMP